MASGPSFPTPTTPTPPPQSSQTTTPFDPAASPYHSGADADRGGEYQWLATARLPGEPGAGLGPHTGAGRTAMYELRPLSTGEVLDRTFSLYRSRFLLFAGIASLSAAVQVLGQAVQLVVLHAMMRGRTDILTLPLSRGYQVANNLLSLVTSLVFLLAFAITQAATIWAMSEVYMGRSASVSSALRATANRWLRYLGIAFWQLGSFAWPPAAVLAVAGALWFANGRSLGGFGVGFLVFLCAAGAVVAGALLYLRNLLAVPVTVREGAGVRASMRRSKLLSVGGKGKLFLVLLIAFGLYMVVATLAGVAIAVTAVLHRGNLLGMLYPTQIIGMIVGFVGYTAISPVVMIGTGLVYFDMRVRKEAYDVAVLLGDESMGPPSAAIPAPVASMPLPIDARPVTPGVMPEAAVRPAQEEPVYTLASVVSEPSAAPEAGVAPEAGAAEHSGFSPGVTERAAAEPLTEPQGGATGL